MCVVYYVFIFLVALKFAFANFLHVDFQVQEQCVQRCRLQNYTDSGHYEDNFGSEIQCAEGCNLWKDALNSSCQKACNAMEESLSSKQLYCLMGCNDAVTKYYTELRLHLGTPPSPALVADSLTATSLKLEWNFPVAREAGLKYFLQWRYEENAGAWEYCRNQSWGYQDTVFVDNLQPYTKYRFRVALILSNLTDPIVSPPSVIISTHAAGEPAHPPTIIRAVPVDSTHISVSWEPGPFPHGPLLSYVLRITDNQPKGYSALKDLPAENHNYIFANLLPSRNYTVSISMRNGVGEGPQAKVLVSTPIEPPVKDSEKPILILGAQHVVIEQGTDLLDEPVILYNTNDFITGLAIHVSQRLLFVSDSARYIHKMPLNNYSNFTKKTVILSPSQMNFIPLDLSMDWLNENLYILGELNHNPKVWQIARCNLYGRGLTVAVAGLRIKPHHFEVDPYNGYLFWVTEIGLFRLDLADVSNGIKHEIQPELILADKNLGAFTVDHTNFRLLVSNQTNKTVYSVSLDGKDISDMRRNIITSKLQKVVSLATANKKFYWTDGNDVLYEEYHPSSAYFHNSYPVQLSRSYIKVLVNLTSSQPTPVPVNPPTSVQAIFGTETAKVSWHSPHLLGGQGKGAWQTWMYEVAIKESNTKFEVVGKTNGTSFSLRNLENNTEYTIKAAAYTSSGKGPGSTEFIGKTLTINKNGKQPIILWSSVDGLLKSEASGENVETIVHKSSMNNFYFNDITWFENNLYLVTNTSQVYWYNMITHENGLLSDIDSVESIAIDWIGKKLYWSNPKQQLIIRGNLNGTQQEPLPILTLAKELNLDSIRGYLYWSTGHAVECAHLNGGDRITYHDSQFFSGKQVMGLTLDMDHHYVYWIVRGSYGSNLFKAPMVGFNKIEQKPPTAEKVTSLQKPYMHGPLCYFSNRLIWLQDDKSAIISNLNGQYSASISSKNLMGLNMIFVMDFSQNIMPNYTKKDLSENISVIPELIEKQSIKTIGTWDNFNITWNPVKNVNFGTVFYELMMDNLSKNNSSITTTHPSIKYWKKIPPYTFLQLYLRAYTYWGASSYIRYKIYSPPSTPSAPRNPRAYVFHQYTQNFSTVINISFRWGRPAQPNGILEGYKLTWWYYKGDQYINNSVIIDSSEKEYVIETHLRNTTYYFHVQAYTEVGGGELSTTILLNTIKETPIPTLLIGSSDSISIYDLDINQNYSLLQGISSPLSIAYLLRERKVFWVNNMQELLVFNTGSLNRSKLLEIRGNAIGVSIDWIERSLYYTQLDHTQGCSIIKLDLNFAETGAIKSTQILRTPFNITKMEVSPYSRKIYWTEHDLDCRCNRMMQANIDGTSITPLFSVELRNQLGLQNCNCPVHPAVEKTFSLDHSDPKQRPTITFINSSNKTLIKSDKSGCRCNVQPFSFEQSVPINSLQSDFTSIYFTNKSSTSVYYQNESNHVKKNLIQANDVLIYGSHMQPYPSLDCLLPNYGQNLTVILKNKTAHSLTLKMPKIKTSYECQNISSATMEYRIYYMPYNDEKDSKCDEGCTRDITLEETLKINNLRPFSKYIFSLGITNYYSSIRNSKIVIGKGVVFQTAPGAPSPPRNVKVTVLNPTLLKVNWLSPQKLNGYHIYYEIHWQTEGLITGIRKKGEQMVMETDIHNTTVYNKYLDELSSNETYSIWVRAYSESNATSTDSEIITITTYPEPNNITLLSKTSSKLNLQWNSSENVDIFSIEYALLISNEWKELKSLVYTHNEANITVERLKPKTQYKFRLRLKYPNYNNDYIWPKDSRFTFETMGDKPSAPGMPVIQHMSNEEYQVRWEPSRDNGAPIELYMLETLNFPIYRTKRSTNHTNWIKSGPHIDEPEWESVYNGTDNFWKVTDLSEKYRYTFRVSSLNSYGWSNMSEESVQFDPSLAALRLAKKQDMTLFIVAVAVPISVVIVLLLLLKCYKMFHEENKKHFMSITRGPDVELATLRELPRRSNFIHNTNILYTSSSFPNTEEITLLPNIRRDQITLKKFLGSGAFGEVFEGLARGLNESEEELKVAVKTLRKGATEQEKSEFLQEAQLMSHFKHKHILQLLGVCLDNDPHFIIMELMQGGDLLTFLRSSRKAEGNSPTLNLLDLTKMCVDVAKGCRYLEEMHFVHRDLACRNCLVSSTDPDSRIVKIGDFGLARDIYKNDYYRKEGEGLLPVRWMAPESLVDGVFTCQSDVWAFGVLLWEIMTLGQQPYPARNNMEVMHYVRSGGRLGKPIDCPKTLYTLMLSCWTYEPERRPTFKYCLDELERLHEEMVNSPVKSVHLGQYISTVPQAFADMDGISNRAYFRDENQNSSGASWKSEEDGVREKTPFLPQTPPKSAEIPKYLEIIYDSGSTIQNDGYEIPRTAFSKSRLEITPDNSASVSLQSDDNQVVNVSPQYLLKDNNVGYTNMNSELIDKLEKCSL